MRKVIDREAPDCLQEVLLVLDATTGQNAISQAKIFGESTGVTGVILTKLDGTAKGGVVIGIRSEFDLPVKLIGVGEQIDNMEFFDAQAFSKALFAGEEANDEQIETEDVQELIEEVEEAAEESFDLLEEVADLEEDLPEVLAEEGPQSEDIEEVQESVVEEPVVKEKRRWWRR